MIGVGEGHSRRIAETSAAARAIESLREAPGDLGDRAIGAPELSSFGSDDDVFETTHQSRDEPSDHWLELEAWDTVRQGTEPADSVGDSATSGGDAPSGPRGRRS